jgi:NMT1/THI5 like
VSPVVRRLRLVLLELALPVALVTAWWVWSADSTETDPTQAYAVDGLGGDYESLRKVAVPYPAIGDAVADGTVDAAYVNEPFLSAALETGKVEVLSYVRGDINLAGAPGAVVIGADDYMAENPDVTERFISALQEAYEYAATHLEEVAEFVPETGLNDRVPPVVALGEYQRGPLDHALIDEVLDVFVKYDVIGDGLTADDVIYTP